MFFILSGLVLIIGLLIATIADKIDNNALPCVHFGIGIVTGIMSGILLLAGLLE